MPRPLRLGVLCAWMALITFWSSQGNLPIDHPPVSMLLQGSQHRLAHLVAFGLVALLARWAFDGWSRPALLAILLTSAFGATDEVHQSLTPGRNPAIDDWLFDTLSAGVAILAWPRLARMRWMPRPLAPAIVTAAFAIALTLAAQPFLMFPGELDRAGIRSATSQVAHSALSLARQTRAAAHQLIKG